MKTSDLIGPALAYAVGIAEGYKVEYWHTKAVTILFPEAPRSVPWNPHSDWSQGGPIIEREKIELVPSVDGNYWYAESIDRTARIERCPTPLIAAMRCYVASKLGDEVEIPEELQRTPA
jgi:hypothetical protein